MKWRVWSSHYNNDKSWWNIYSHDPVIAETADELAEIMPNGLYYAYALEGEAQEVTFTVDIVPQPDNKIIRFLPTQ